MSVTGVSRFKDRDRLVRVWLHQGLAGLAASPHMIADEELEQRLAAVAVVVVGPKVCGETATARQHAASKVLLDVDSTGLAQGLAEDGLDPDRTPTQLPRFDSPQARTLGHIRMTDGGTAAEPEASCVGTRTPTA